MAMGVVELIVVGTVLVAIIGGVVLFVMNGKRDEDR